jgi:hypothetical protein
MIERLLLIDVENDRVQYSTSQLRSRWCHHPLGLLYLTAAVMKRFPDISIKIFHTITSDYPLNHIESLLTDYTTLSVVRGYRGTALFDMLQPNEEQARALATQEQAMVQPKLFDDQCFYG